MAETTAERTRTVGDSMPPLGNKADDDLVHMVRLTRNRVDALVSDPNIRFYAKLYALARSLRDEDPRVTHAQVVKRLDDPASKHEPVMLTSPSLNTEYKGNLVVGYLDEDDPWGFKRYASPGSGALIGLRATFAAVRQLNVDYIGRPSLSILDTNELNVGLDPRTSEHLFDSVEVFAGSLVVGELAMHEYVSSAPIGRLDANRRDAFHADVTMALAEMSADLAVQNG